MIDFDGLYIANTVTKSSNVLLISLNIFSTVTTSCFSKHNQLRACYWNAGIASMDANVPRLSMLRPCTINVR